MMMRHDRFRPGDLGRLRPVKQRASRSNVASEGAGRSEGRSETRGASAEASYSSAGAGFSSGRPRRLSLEPAVTMQPDSERPANLRCRSCGAPIFWAVNSNGNRVPIDAEPVQIEAAGRYAIDWPDAPNTSPRAIHSPAIHLTHFATCPNAASHRKRASAA
jgi:hypothetical protein